MPRCLIIDDDHTFCELLSKGLERLGVETAIATSRRDALSLIQEKDFSHATLDLNLGKDNGLMVIESLLEHSPALSILILTGYASISTTVEAIQKGALSYLPKPVVAQDVYDVFFKAPEATELAAHDSDIKEWERIQFVLASEDFNVTKAAQKLGMHRRTLQRKLQKRQYFQ